MQDFRSIAGGTMFGAGVETRLRPLSHHQDLKCPRCNSLNTKFCYYNNYNMSQPRHFCKSCRRYWTAGGVLRNVPVGGGCRKNRRSKAKPTSSRQDAPPPPPAEAAANSPPPRLRDPKPSSCSSNESASLTPPASTAEATPLVLAASFAGACLLTTTGGYEPLAVPTPDCGNISALLGPGAGTGRCADTGSLTGHITATAATSGLEVSGVLLSQANSDTCQLYDWAEQDDNPTTLVDLFDQADRAETELSAMRAGGLGPSDWQVKDQGAFDLPSTVDQVYWSQWTDQRDQGQHPEHLPPVNFSQFLS